MDKKGLLFSLKLKEEELTERVHYCEKMRNRQLHTNNFNKEIEWDCKRIDAENELEDIRESIKKNGT